MDIDELFNGVDNLDIAKTTQRQRTHRPRPITKLAEEIIQDLEKKFSELDLSKIPRQKRKVVQTLVDGFKFHIDYAKKHSSLRYPSLQYAAEILERLTEVLEMPTEDFLRIHRDIKKSRARDRRASATIKWDNSTLWLQGQFFGKPVNVMVRAQTPLSALAKLPESTWGHANKLVMRHIMPKIAEIAQELLDAGEYKLL